MSKSAIVARTLSAIDAAYGSRLAPTFDFVSADRARRAYEGVLSGLSKSFNVVDTTDENDDVALVLALRRNGRTMTLYLSMLGRFAALLTMDECKPRFVNDEIARVDPDLSIVAELLDAGDVALLGGEILRRAVALHLPGESDATLFRALFSDIDPTATQ